MNAAEIIAGRKTPYLTLSKRIMAAWIDLLPFMILGVLFYNNFPNAREIVLDVTAVLYLGYHIIFEGNTGYTIGKALLRIKVVDIQLNDPGCIRTTIRTIFRIFEINPFLLGIPAIVMILLFKNHQRLGDILSMTYVLEVGEIREAAEIEQGEKEDN